MFYRFTYRSRMVLSLAIKEAPGAKAGAVNMEHVLLGLLHEGTGVGVHALRKLGVDLERLERSIRDDLKANSQAGVGSDNSKAEASKKSLVDRVAGFLRGVGMGSDILPKKIIHNAIKISKGRGDKYVGTEHLVAAILETDESGASMILREMGVTAEKLEHATLAVQGKKTE